MNSGTLVSKLRSLRSKAKDLSLLSSEQKNLVLTRAAEALVDSQARILTANRKDLRQFDESKKKINEAFIDRLRLNEERIAQMARSLEQVACQPDPLVSDDLETKTLTNGLKLRKVRAPLGVIFLIFESRPNVALEAFSLSFKAGNCTILKGGRESVHTTKAIYQILSDVLEAENLSKDCFWGLTDLDRSATHFLLSQKNWIDVVIPRGGEKLIQYVTQNSKIPIIKNDRGLCHIYVHEDADHKMASEIIVNAKTQRPGVCNAMETLLVHEKIARELIPVLYANMESYPVEWLACPKSFRILRGKKWVRRASAQSWNLEHLALRMNCKVVTSVGEALSHIDQYGSRHSESIITRSETIARQFQSQVDAAVTYWNASTRFTDGFEFGFGGEIGISTQKLHVRGPVGLEALTCMRWVVDGSGQVRG